MDIRIGNGYDVHALAEGLELWLGGVRVESPIGCIAHSDGDVALHALCDALLGALALGDIGKHSLTLQMSSLESTARFFWREWCHWCAPRDGRSEMLM